MTAREFVRKNWKGDSKGGLASNLALLKKHSIEVLVDIRSRPYSRYVPRFSGESLQKTLPQSGLRYLYMGEHLGGKPENPEFYNSEGKVDYAPIAASITFRKRKYPRNLCSENSEKSFYLKNGLPHRPDHQKAETLPFSPFRFPPKIFSTPLTLSEGYVTLKLPRVPRSWRPEAQKKNFFPQEKRFEILPVRMAV